MTEPAGASPLDTFEEFSVYQNLWQCAAADRFGEHHRRSVEFSPSPEHHRI
jgi:hypothetical protein